MNKLLENHQIYQGKHCFGFAYISPEFIFRQNATDNLEELKDLYMFKHYLYDNLDTCIYNCKESNNGAQ